MRHLFAAAPALLLVAACSTAPAPAAAPPGPAFTSAKVAKVEKVCTKEYPIGSSIPVTHCRAPMTDAERQRMQDELSQQIRPVGSKPPGN